MFIINETLNRLDKNLFRFLKTCRGSSVMSGCMSSLQISAGNDLLPCNWVIQLFITKAINAIDIIQSSLL